MKIAITTMSRDISFGGNLQAYALQKTIFENSKSSCLHIARENKRHRIFVKIKTARNILTNINRLVHYGSHRRKMRLFESFQERYLLFTDGVYSDENASQLNRQFDCFVTGSDQVWNCAIGINKILFLEFADKDKMKVSYAASIGLSEIPVQYKDDFSRIVSTYDFISVREKSAKELVEGLTGKRCVHVLDPVFLRDVSEWKMMAGKRIISKKYIFVYATQVSDDLIECVRQCEKMTGYKVISVHKLLNYKTIEFKSGPLEFLNYIYYAEYVITSSFHCAAFSLIFSKNLMAIPHGTTGVRMTDLLETLGASNSLYSGKFVLSEKYKADETQRNILREREKSLRYIKDFLMWGERKYG